ncbi:hypothetical protein [Aquitalea sp. ASV11]|uniref:hypothetical protein n=1 Tax=Aquitalea sp. ASV11 TaxID=2795103 RepID=UPI0018EADB55|nr:hypothetical protein [Aquitalea sp. ASV11]
MKVAIKTSLNIFLSRASGQMGVVLIFCILGYMSGKEIGDLNVFLSFFAIFSSIASVSMVYFQNCIAESESQVIGLLFNKGWQLASLLGFFLSAIAILLAFFTFNDTRFFYPIIIACLVFPFLGVMAFLTFYLESIGEYHIPARIYLVVNLVQPLIFALIFQFDVGVLFSVSITFIVIDVVVFSLLGFFCRASFVFNKVAINCNDIVEMVKKGGSLSVGVAVQKYAFSLIIIAVGSFGVFSANVYAVLTSLIFMLMLPMVGIAHAGSIFISKGARFDFKNCLWLALFYFLFILILIYFFLPSLLKFLYKFSLNYNEVYLVRIPVLLFWFSQVFMIFSISIARAFYIIKFPQIIACSSLFAGLFFGKRYSVNVYDFMSSISFFILVGSFLIFAFILFKKNFLIVKN